MEDSTNIELSETANKIIETFPDELYGVYTKGWFKLVPEWTNELFDNGNLLIFAPSDDAWFESGTPPPSVIKGELEDAAEAEAYDAVRRLQADIINTLSNHCVVIDDGTGPEGNTPPLPENGEFITRDGVRNIFEEEDGLLDYVALGLSDTIIPAIILKTKAKERVNELEPIYGPGFGIIIVTAEEVQDGRQGLFIYSNDKSCQPPVRFDPKPFKPAQQIYSRIVTKLSEEPDSPSVYIYGIDGVLENGEPDCVLKKINRLAPPKKDIIYKEVIKPEIKHTKSNHKAINERPPKKWKISKDVIIKDINNKKINFSIPKANVFKLFRSGGPFGGDPIIIGNVYNIKLGEVIGIQINEVYKQECPGTFTNAPCDNLCGQLFYDPDQNKVRSITNKERTDVFNGRQPKLEIRLGVITCNPVREDFDRFKLRANLSRPSFTLNGKIEKQQGDEVFNIDTINIDQSIKKCSCTTFPPCNDNK